MLYRYTLVSFVRSAVLGSALAVFSLALGNYLIMEEIAPRIPTGDARIVQIFAGFAAGSSIARAWRGELMAGVMPAFCFTIIAVVSVWEVGYATSALFGGCALAIALLISLTIEDTRILRYADLLFFWLPVFALWAYVAYKFGGACFEAVDEGSMLGFQLVGLGAVWLMVLAAVVTAFIVTYQRRKRGI